METLSTLIKKTCKACEGGVPKFSPEEITQYSKLVPGWSVERNHHLRREFLFKDFVSALGFVNLVGDIAEQEGHHPDISLSWGKVVVELHTHALDGLSENDFILAAKIDGIPR